MIDDGLGPLEALADDDEPMSMLDLVDHLLDQGCVLRAEVVLGLAGIDLVFAELSAVLCSAHRVLGPGGPREGRRPATFDMLMARHRS
jgi:hypothetical protein